jgi:hypothetical protein
VAHTRPHARHTALEWRCPPSRAHQASRGAGSIYLRTSGAEHAPPAFPGDPASTSLAHEIMTPPLDLLPLENAVLQLCLRCGRHEQTGSFCTWCRTASYDLTDHRDLVGNGCPLGALLDLLPGGHPATPSMVRHFLAQPHKAILEATPNRHHPRAAGYLAETDPPVPAWIPVPVVTQPRRGDHDPKDVQLAA